MGFSTLTNIISAAQTKVSALDAVYIALIGTALVFAILIILMLVIWLFGFIMSNSPKIAAKYPKVAGFVPKIKAKIVSAFKKPANAAATVTLVEETDGPTVVVSAEPLAPGTCGELTLINTTERDAAMIMAIVADATETPLNQLRFKSIKNVSVSEEK